MKTRNPYKLTNLQKDAIVSLAQFEAIELSEGDVFTIISENLVRLYQCKDFDDSEYKVVCVPLGSKGERDEMYTLYSKPGDVSTLSMDEWVILVPKAAIES